MLSYILKIIGIIVAAILVGAVALFINGAIVMLLWNWLMPYLFGLPELTIWMAIGLAALIGIISGVVRVKISN